MGANNREDVADVLDKAAAILLEDGWTQGAMFRFQRGGGVAMCAMGGITTAAHKMNAMTAVATQRFWDYLDAHEEVNVLDENGHPITGIGDWNDVDGRTVYDVTVALHKAAAWTREQA